MTDFPICAVRWDATKPGRTHAHTRVCARLCLVKPSSFIARRSLRLPQAFPGSINLGGRESRTIFKPRIFASKFLKHISSGG